jgi:hypothetical protein
VFLFAKHLFVAAMAEGCLVEKKEAPSSGWGASEDGA